MVKFSNTAEMVERLFAGEHLAAARIITLVENEMDGYHDIMRQVYQHTGEALIVGITGSGGVGKSSLTNHVIKKFRDQDKTVGVVVVDPSSPFSGGAFLGDRIRLNRHTQDEGVYIRSLASRGYLGGLSRATYNVVRIMEAMGKDVIIVETLGAGQDEIDVIHIAQTCLLVITPGMGDDIQAMKAGIMEIADIIVINKADLDGAEIALRHLQAALTVAPIKEGAWVPRVTPTVSVGSKPDHIKGIDTLMELIGEHQSYLHESESMAQVKFERIEQELGLIFTDELQKLVFKGLKGTGKKKKYIEQIMQGKSDPYSVVEEVLQTYILAKE